MKHCLLRLLAIWSFSCASAAFAGDGLITQLETDHVDITTHFTGEQILFFGSLSSPGDVVVKVTSPSQDVAVSQKAKVGPVWLDGGRMVVRGAPGLFYLAATKPLDQLLDPQERERYGLSLEHGLTSGHKEGAEVPGWEQAFIRLKKAKQYYRELGDGVTLVKDKLFFTRLVLPAKLPEGKYELNAYLIRNGKVVATQTEGLNVREVSLERWVSMAAHEHAWLYGGVFTLACMGLGLVLGMLLRRNKDD
jgi:uncharacterized protein (TIGR02186 family)